MVRITNDEDLRKDLTKKLIAESNPSDRCSNFRNDNVGPYCGRDLVEGKPILKDRRLICDNYSLQF